jgi:hypothetical protein
VKSYTRTRTHLKKEQEQKLLDDEKALEEDAAKFDAFLKENDKNSVEAIKRSPLMIHTADLSNIPLTQSRTGNKGQIGKNSRNKETQYANYEYT